MSDADGRSRAGGSGSRTDEIQTPDTLRERTGVNRAAFWFLLTGNRWVIAGGLAVTVFAIFVILGTVKGAPLRPLMQSSNMVTITFSGLVGAIITSSTLVVSINQLVLSQNIGSLATIRNRMDVGMDFRQNTDELLGETTPTDPATYLGDLIATTESRARALQTSLTQNNDPELRERVDEYVDDLLQNAERTRQSLADNEFGSLQVIKPAIDYDYNRKMHDARRFKREYADDLTAEQSRTLQELLQSLTMYGTVRAYANGLYIQTALIKLSRAIIYSAVIALVVSAIMAIFVDSNTLTGTVLGVDSIVWIVSAAFTVAILPFFIFASYILRLGTLTKQTLTVEPLLLH